MTYGKSGIEPSEAWDILDSTKVTSFMKCPRMFFYEHVLGWRIETPSVHLKFGEAWHAAKEVIRLRGCSDESIVEAMEAFRAIYSETFSPEDDLANFPKNTANALNGLMAYKEFLSNTRDDFETRSTEICGTVPITSNRTLHFRLDAIGKRPSFGDLIVIRDDKTSSQKSQGWISQWSLSTQIGTYLHAAFSLYGPYGVWGAEIEGAFFKKTFVEFLIVPVKKTVDQMSVWLAHTTYWVERLLEEFDALEQSSPDNEVLEAFPMCTESCSSYPGCIWQDFCLSWPNPLRRAEAPPAGFKLEYWDPRINRQKAKEVVDL